MMLNCFPADSGVLGGARPCRGRGAAVGRLLRPLHGAGEADADGEARGVRAGHERQHAPPQDAPDHRRHGHHPRRHAARGQPHHRQLRHGGDGVGGRQRGGRQRGQHRPGRALRGDARGQGRDQH